MKALRLVKVGPPPLLVEDEMSRPRPRPGEVLVRVRASAVTPTELLWHTTTHTQDGGPRTAAILGHEFSGEIAECGEGMGEFAIGSEVYGMNDWFDEGALAEYCITKPAWIANKPSSLSHETAASVPISALTAWQGLLEHGRLQRAERVLIHGGAGSVGSFAVQIADQHGARVITTVSARDIAFVKSVGAEEALDYRSTLFEDLVREIDLVFDTVGGDILRRSWQVLRPGGRMVTVAADSESASDEPTRQGFFIVVPNRAQLEKVGQLLDLGKLRTAHGTVLPVSRAAEAYAGAIVQNRPGKAVISTDSWSASEGLFAGPTGTERREGV